MTTSSPYCPWPGPRYCNLRYPSVRWPTDSSQDGSKVISGGADKAARCFDLGSAQTSQVAAHEQPIRVVKFITHPQAGEMLVTGSWDKTIKYWDLRQPTPAATVQMPERVYTMDVSQSLLVVGTADRHLPVINIQNPNAIFKTLTSPLKWQTRVVSCFPDATGFAVGSTEGRCAIQYVDDKSARYTASP